MTWQRFEVGLFAHMAATLFMTGLIWSMTVLPLVRRHHAVTAGLEARVQRLLVLSN